MHDVNVQIEEMLVALTKNPNGGHKAFEEASMQEKQKTSLSRKVKCYDEFDAVKRKHV